VLYAIFGSDFLVFYYQLVMLARLCHSKRCLKAVALVVCDDRDCRVG
jgi:hypothetical protein